MANAFNPLRNPGAYDFVEIAGRENPGIAIVSGFKRDFGWDVKKGKGTKGATITLTDYPPCEGSIKFLLWTEEHFDEWTEFRELFRYDKSKKPAPAVDIWHPALEDVGVNSVVCKSIGPLVHEGKQLYSITVELLEYWPPPKKASTSTPSGSKGSDWAKDKLKKGAGGSSGDSIADEQQRKIAELLKKAQEP